MSFAILYAQKGHLCYLKITSFSWFSIFIQFDPFKKCSWVMFSHFWQKSDPKTYCNIQTQNFKTFSKILTIDNFHVAKGHKRLRGVLRGIPDPIHIVPQLYFNLIRLLCAASRARTENREFYIWLDLWSGLIVLYHHWRYRYNLQQIWKAWQSEKWTVSPFFWTWNSCSAESLTIKISYFFCSLSGWYQYLF